MSSKLRGIPLIVLAVGLIALPGCGITLEGGASSAGEAGPVREAPLSGGENGSREAHKNLPPRPDGVVRIDGKAQGSLTESLIEDYEKSGSEVTFEVNSDDETRAFDAFCAGRADIVDAARPISPGEYAACRSNNIKPVQIQVASDAAVLAIENETNVGVDCISLRDVREIFRAASPVTNWSQVGYGERDAANPDAPSIKVAGPDARSNVFGFFGQFVLGNPEPSPVLLRSNYKSFPTDRGVRLAVVGNKQDRLNAEGLEQSRQDVNDLRASIGDARRALADAKFEVAKGIRDGRSATEKARDRDTLAAAELNLSKLLNDLPAAKETGRRAAAAAARVAQHRGTLGLFRFSYYELFEEQLRPMEIEATDSEQNPECIFPSQLTVTNATYPLARQLLLTVDLNAMKEADINGFLSFAVANSQAVATDEALVPLPDQVRNTELAWLRGDTPPDVVYYPPSEVRRDMRSERNSNKAG